MANADEERGWVLRAKEGDTGAYRLLVERYESRIYGLVAGMLGPGHKEIEDVVQGVFIKAYFSLKKFRGDAGFGTWVYRIAVNRAKDELKKGVRTIPLDENLSEESVRALGALYQQPDSDDEEVPAPTRELQQFVRSAVAALPEKMRIVVTLKDLEGFSYEQVGGILKCSVGTVKSRHARARQQLREALSPYIPELSGRTSHEV